LHSLAKKGRFLRRLKRAENGSGGDEDFCESCFHCSVPAVINKVVFIVVFFP
jgi:hypothetical protein